MAKTAAEPERVVSGHMTAAQLVEEPRLARLYTSILLEGEGQSTEYR
ncbi:MULTISPECIES: hypothetical protein [Halorubrum]|nr:MULTISPECIES: hypothetical protein [Halorubrum]